MNNINNKPEIEKLYNEYITHKQGLIKNRDVIQVMLDNTDLNNLGKTKRYKYEELKKELKIWDDLIKEYDELLTNLNNVK